MTSVQFTGWEPGLQKVALDKLLRDRAGLSLREAFQHVNRLLAGEVISVPMPNVADAHALAAEASSLGAVVQVIEQPAVGRPAGTGRPG